MYHVLLVAPKATLELIMVIYKPSLFTREDREGGGVEKRGTGEKAGKSGLCFPHFWCMLRACLEVVQTKHIWGYSPHVDRCAQC